MAQPKRGEQWEAKRGQPGKRRVIEVTSSRAGKVKAVNTVTGKPTELKASTVLSEYRRIKEAAPAAPKKPEKEPIVIPKPSVARRTEYAPPPATATAGADPGFMRIDPPKTTAANPMYRKRAKREKGAALLAAGLVVALVVAAVVVYLVFF